MKILDDPLGTYYGRLKGGLTLLAALAALRFVLLPAGVSAQYGSLPTSFALWVPVVMVVYAMRGSREKTSYRDMLGVALALGVWQWALVSAGIMADDYLGIDTYYTTAAGPAAGRTVDLMAVHTIATILLVLILWGLGCVLIAVGRSSR